MKIVSILLLALLVGCSGPMLFVHQPDIQQGNLLNEENLAQLKVGMTREQVEFLFGAPISHDSFADNRDDYVYYLKPNHQPPVYKQLTVLFNAEGKVREFKVTPPN